MPVSPLRQAAHPNDEGCGAPSRYEDSMEGSQGISDRVADEVNRHSFRFSHESDLQTGIAQLLTSLSVPFRREVVLSPKDRIDFLLSEKVGIEVKIDMSLAAVTRQLWRYVDFPEIERLILVTTRQRHTQVPDEMKGKPIRTVYLVNSFL